MAVAEKIDTLFAGLGPDGKPRSYVVRSGEYPARSVDDWISLRLSAISEFRGTASYRAIEALLRAGGDAAVRAAVRLGEDMGEWQRHGVGKVLDRHRDAAREYPAAAALAERNYRAWTAAWGTEQPAPRRQGRTA